MPRRLKGRPIILLTSAVSLGIGLLLPAPEGALAAQSPATFQVKVSSSSFVDDTRGTPARNGEPAQSTRTIHELIYVPEGAPGPLPTVIFAPGWDNQSSTYDPLLRAMASAGYLVIGVDSPGSSSYFPGKPYPGSADEDLANNTIDLSAALGNVEEGALGRLVDRSEVSAVGHSDGGSEVANLALNSGFLSDRFNAYVVLSGDVPDGSVPGTFGPYNNGPVLAMVGTADEYGNFTPQPDGDGTESVYSTARATKIFVTLAGATHLSAYIGDSSQAADTRAAIVDFLDVVDFGQPASRASFAAATSTDGLSAQEDLGPGSTFEGPTAVGLVATSDDMGYWIAWSDGTVSPFGDAPSLSGAARPIAPIVAITTTPSGRGYWLVSADGMVYPFGDAANHGGLATVHLDAPIVAMADDPATGGYWLLGGDGGVFSFDAPFYGSTGNIHLVAPAVGMAATLDGKGYYFAAADGGVFAYGDARFSGSAGGQRLTKPVVGMALDPDTGGYWLDASDGGIFSFDAPFYGSTGNIHLVAPAVGMAAPASPSGYWLVAADGGVFTFGRATFYGSGA